MRFWTFYCILRVAVAVSALCVMVAYAMLAVRGYCVRQMEKGL